MLERKGRARRHGFVVGHTTSGLAHKVTRAKDSKD